MITAIWLIQAGVALTMVVFGVNQLMNPGAWVKYLPAWMIRTSPMKPETSMRIHALGNIVFGLFLVFSFGFPLVAAWIAFVWWLSIIPFAFKLDWTIGMRDLSIAISLAALIFLLSI